MGDERMGIRLHGSNIRVTEALRTFATENVRQHLQGGGVQ